MQGIWVVAFALQWLLLVALTIVMGGVLRYLASNQERLQLAAPFISRFELGEKVPDFELPDLDSRPVNLAALLNHAQNVLLLFLDPGCSSCKTVVLQLAELSRRDSWRGRSWSPVLLLGGDEPAAWEMAQPLEAQEGFRILFDADSEVARQYGVRHRPSGLAINPQGRVVDQSMNPHANWLYKALAMLPPERPIVWEGSGGWESLAIPAIYSDAATR